MNKRAFGTEGEQTARNWLVAQGWQVLEMNYRRPTGEIDIIARRRGLTAFIEVKRRTTDRFGRPAEAVTPQKRLHILRTAMVYMQENDLADRPVRFDVVEVIQGEVRHIEGAFDATGMA